MSASLPLVFIALYLDKMLSDDDVRCAAPRTWEKDACLLGVCVAGFSSVKRLDLFGVFAASGDGPNVKMYRSRLVCSSDLNSHPIFRVDFDVFDFDAYNAWQRAVWASPQEVSETPEK